MNIAACSDSIAVVSYFTWIMPILPRVYFLSDDFTIISEGQGGGTYNHVSANKHVL